jgi:hypothetical protein
MADKIFISYRRDDSKADARSIYQRLERAFGESRLFMDVDTIESGENFRDVLNSSLSDCRAMLVVIGRRWLGIEGANGKPRLHDEGDFVNIEVANALQRRVSLIPVLVDGAKMPSVDQLPEKLKGLASMQAAIVTHENFSSDMDKLERRLGALVSGRKAKIQRFAVLAVGIAAIGLAGWWWVRRNPGPTAPSLACSNEIGAKTPGGRSDPAALTFKNETGETVRVFWLDTVGQRVPYMTLSSGSSYEQSTYANHVWVVTDLGAKCLRLVTAKAPASSAVVK